MGEIIEVEDPAFLGRNGGQKAEDGRETKEDGGNKLAYLEIISKYENGATQFYLSILPTLRKLTLFYNCRESSTNRPLFMQNKANFRKSQMYIKLNITRDYEKNLNWTLGENKPNPSTSLRTSFLKQKTDDRRLRTERQMIENSLDIMASATKNACLMGLNKNRKSRKIEANAAV